MTDDQPQDILAHYASKYYDPVKAKEYYERTKKLKGRHRAVSGLDSKKKKEAWQITRSNVSKENQAAKDKLQEKRNAKLTQLRNKAAAAQERIAEKLEKALAQKLDLMVVPQNASPKLRAFIASQNAMRTAKSNSEKKAAAKTASEARQKIGNELRSAVSSVRDKYNSDRKALADKYQKTLDTEYNNIKSTGTLKDAKPKKAAPKKKSAKK